MRPSRAAQTRGDKEGHLKRLRGVEARIAMRLIAGGEIRFRDIRSAAGAFRHIAARHLKVNAARPDAFGFAKGEEAFDLGKDAREAARFMAGAGGLGVAVHGVGTPNDVAARRLDRA